MRPSLFARPFSPKNRLAGESAQCRILFATRTYRRRLPSACATRRVLIRFSKDEERAKSLRQTALAATQSTKISNLPFLRRKKYAALGESACPTRTQVLARQCGTDAFVCQSIDPREFFTRSDVRGCACAATPTLRARPGPTGSMPAPERFPAPRSDRSRSLSLNRSRY